MALVGVPVLGASRFWIIVSHFAAAATLFVLVYNNVRLQFWGGADLYAVLALGTLLAPFVTGLHRPGRHSSSDYFALVFGAVSVSYGAVRLLLPGHFSAPTVNPVWWSSFWLYGTGFLAAHIRMFGPAFVVAGAVLALAQVLPALPSWLYRAAHFPILVPCLAYAAGVSIPLLTWTAILLYVGFSVLVASLPWTGPRLRRIDPRSFSVRLSCALAVAAAIPLIATMGMVTGSQERVARAEVEDGLEASAATLASDVSHYIGLHRDSLTALAAYPGLLALSPADQRVVLQRYKKAFPDVLIYGTYDATGQGIARTDDLPPVSVAGLDVFEQARRTLGPSLEVRISLSRRVPVFAAAAPVSTPDGRFAGAVGTSLDSAHVAAILNRVHLAAGGRVYLVDAAGHAIAHPDQSLVARFADLSRTPEVAALLASPPIEGWSVPAGPAEHWRPTPGCRTSDGRWWWIARPRARWRRCATSGIPLSACCSASSSWPSWREPTRPGSWRRRLRPCPGRPPGWRGATARYRCRTVGPARSRNW